MSVMFGIFPVIVIIGIIIIFGSIIIGMGKGVVQWNKNNNSPILTVEVRVTGKRIAVSHHHGGTEPHHTSSSTDYFVTFEVESGDRMELCVPDREYGMIAEGDFGRLTFQGTRYKEFERFK